MRKFNPRYLYTAVATAAVMAAVVVIPSWAASGGDSSAQSGQTAPAPYGLTRANAPSAAEIKQNRDKLEAFASCLKDHGVSVPSPGSTDQPPAPPSSSEQKEIAKDCGTPPAPPPGLPPLSGKQADQAQKAMAKGDCPPPPALPVPPGNSNGS